MLTIPQALHRIKGQLTEVVPPSLPATICKDLGLRHRRRTLTPAVTTYLFLRQVLKGNPAAGALRHLSGLGFTDSAYCQARARLPVAFFRRLAGAVTDRCAAESGRDGRWRGHRVFLVDGSSFSMPDAPELREAFGQPTNQAEGCGFPVAHLLVLFDAHGGFLRSALASPLRTHDLSRAWAMHPELSPGDVLVGDRAFCSFAHLALLRSRRRHGLFRAHQRLIVDFRPRRRHAGPRESHRGQAGRPRSRWLRRLGRHDQLVEYHKPAGRPAWMSDEASARLPERLVVRELRVQVRAPGRRVHELTLVTTLLDPVRYPARAVAELYGMRWQAAVNLRHLKETLGMDVLRCQTVPGVVKELLVFVAAYNLVRRVMLGAARRQRVAPDRVSFIDALRWLREARPGDGLPRLVVNPLRPGRAEPRARKRRPKQYDLMRQPRDKLRKRLFRKRHAA